MIFVLYFGVNKIHDYFQNIYFNDKYLKRYLKLKYLSLKKIKPPCITQVLMKYDIFTDYNDGIECSVHVSGYRRLCSIIYLKI